MSEVVVERHLLSGTGLSRGTELSLATLSRGVGVVTAHYDPLGQVDPTSLGNLSPDRRAEIFHHARSLFAHPILDPSASGVMALSPTPLCYVSSSIEGIARSLFTGRVVPDGCEEGISTVIPMAVKGESPERLFAIAHDHAKEAAQLTGLLARLGLPDDTYELRRAAEAMYAYCRNKHDKLSSFQNLAREDLGSETIHAARTLFHQHGIAENEIVSAVGAAESICGYVLVLAPQAREHHRVIIRERLVEDHRIVAPNGIPLEAIAAIIPCGDRERVELRTLAARFPF